MKIGTKKPNKERLDPQAIVVVITGASSGIGAATARVLAKQGSTVVLAARRADELAALAAEINHEGGHTHAIPTDVGRRGDIDRLVKQTIEMYGRIDVFINNAGVSIGSAIADSDDAAMQQIVDVNLLAPARCIQSVLPHMRQRRRGMIINVGSVFGEVGTSGLYSATKFGLRGLNDSLRGRLRRDNIDVVLIEPGIIRTAMTSGVRVPMPGPDTVAHAIAHAIQHPRRRVVVPWMYTPLIYLARMLPGVTDRLIGTGVFDAKT